MAAQKNSMEELMTELEQLLATAEMQVGSSESKTNQQNEDANGKEEVKRYSTHIKRLKEKAGEDCAKVRQIIDLLNEAEARIRLSDHVVIQRFTSEDEAFSACSQKPLTEFTSPQEYKITARCMSINFSRRRRSKQSVDQVYQTGLLTSTGFAREGRPAAASRDDEREDRAS